MGGGRLRRAAGWRPPLPICGNVWHVSQVYGITSFVTAPLTTLKWPPSWQRKQPGKSWWPMKSGYEP